MTLFLTVSFALLFGVMFTRVTNLLRLPDVTAYLISGLLIGPYVLGRLGIEGLGFTSAESVAQLDVISDAALGFIAFAIGNEFRASSLRATGRQALIVGVLQALITALVVDVVLIGVHFIVPDTLSISAAITLGAIASATAPAATLMVVRQYKAKGKVTDILLPVVALDDAVGLAVFAVSFGIAGALDGGGADIISMVAEPALEIACSLALGALLGLLLAQIERPFHSNRNRVSMVIGFVLATVGLSMLRIDLGPVTISFSSLLVCMMLGTVFCNASPLSAEIMDKADKWTAPLMALFFVLSGAALEPDVFSDVAVVGIGAAYIAARTAGKYFGADISCAIAHTDPVVRKWLGVTLFPQAGVALGMCVTAATLPDGALIRNIVLMGVLIYELFGPLLTKLALTRSGDIIAPGPEITNRRERVIESLRSRK